jgi:hypothetical protein
MKQIQQFLDYVVMQEPAVMTYHTSDMILAIHSNGSYLNEENAHSRAGGAPFLIGKCSLSSQQWCNSQQGIHHQGSHVIRIGRQTWIDERTKGSQDTKYFAGDGTSTALHPRGIRQFNSRQNNQLMCVAEVHKSHGHEIPLAQQPNNQPAAIQILLATGSSQQS